MYLKSGISELDSELTDEKSFFGRLSEAGDEEYSGVTSFGCDVLGKEVANEGRDIRAGCIDGHMLAVILGMVVKRADIDIVCAHML